MKYFYARVSTKEQNLARQIETAEKYNIPTKNIYCDKISGRIKERPQYDILKERLVRGDEVYFQELDRIGREKALIKDELEWFKSNGIIVRVLDLPTTLIEFPAGQEWVLEMVNNILIEVLGTIAEQEWEKIRKRRNEGIAAMPIVDGKRVSTRTGMPTGRPSKGIDITEMRCRVAGGEITVTAACKELGISRQTWYRLVG